AEHGAKRTFVSGTDRPFLEGFDRGGFPGTGGGAPGKLKRSEAGRGSPVAPVVPAESLSMYWWSDVPSLLPVAVVVAIVLLLVWYYRPSDWVVRIRDGRVECSGKKPIPRRAELEEYLLDELKLTGPVKIMGRRQGGRLRVWFSGNL